tara:strand:- start:829 stop:1941 length:1113 start_codon:yes stop_codon:yes gene_type:complete
MNNTSSEMNIETPSDYKMTEFYTQVLITIPKILKELYKTEKGKFFYVKGGKAADAYLSKSTFSPDWDIIVYAPENSTEYFDTVVRFLVDKLNTNYVSISLNINQKEIQGYQLGFPEHNLYSIDIFPGDEKLTLEQFQSKQEVKKGIPYLKLPYLLADLAKTAQDRKEQLTQANRLLPTSSGIESRKRAILQSVKKNRKKLTNMINNSYDFVNLLSLTKLTNDNVSNRTRSATKYKQDYPNRLRNMIKNYPDIFLAVGQKIYTKEYRVMTIIRKVNNTTYSLRAKPEYKSKTKEYTAEEVINGLFVYIGKVLKQLSKFDATLENFKEGLDEEKQRAISQLTDYQKLLQKYNHLLEKTKKTNQRYLGLLKMS